ncbi:MAG: 50S ribosomal protein L11 methyltransferase, partial [Longimicrobiales bacterium]|nr:50S ribosomal protein L11 methyltransferase [Longimicrobiales bacterium]
MTRDRRWLELRVRVQDSVARELVPDALVALGARGVVEDEAGHVAYFQEPPEPEAFVAAARDRLEADGGADAEVEWRWQEHEDWAHAWKRGLGPRRITPRLVVHPSWKRPRDLKPRDVVIVLDPGMAFGTAEHGTTRCCLRLLDEIVEQGDRILDVGAGSGILSVAAVRLGAEEVTAVEGDPLACEAMEENLWRNAVSSRVRIVTEWADA